VTSVDLHSLRVLDLSTNTPGPFGSQILADLGMTVLKIESPGNGDPERLVAPEYFRAYNRGKRSAVLDLKDDGDRSVLYNLAAGADVFIEGFRPGVVERLGVGYSDLLPLKPDLVYVSLPGFRSGGPYARMAGHDPEYLARMGALDFAPKLADGSPGLDSPFYVADYAAGMYGVIAILAALLREPREPVRIEIPLFAAGLAWLFPKIVHGLEADAPPAGHATGVGVFRTADDRFITITATEPHNWKKLCELIGEPELAVASEYATAMDRRQNPKGNDVIGQAIVRRTLSEWNALFSEHQIPAAAVQTVAEALEDPAVLDLGILHREPTLHIDSPLLGFPVVSNERAPALDEAGDAVRALGWQALEP
jgi:CoA:oxalate CoA-transferase